MSIDLKKIDISCPSIDSVIDFLEERSCDDAITISSIEAHHIIKNLEKIRSINSDLRECCQKLQKDLENREADLDFSERELDLAKNEISTLEDRISELEESLK